jgi:hypothetical protein
MNQPEEDPESYPKAKTIPFSHSRIYLCAASVAAAAILVIVLGISRFGGPSMEIVYNTLPVGIIRILPEDQETQSITPEEYSAYLGLNIAELTPSAELIKANIAVKKNNGVISSDECIAYYNVDGQMIMIHFSKSVNVTPSDLAEGTPSYIEGQTILAGTNGQSEGFSAAFQHDALSICLFTRQMTQQSFEAFLLELLQAIS